MRTREYAGSCFAIIIGILYFIDIKANMWSFHFVHDNIFHVCGNLLALSYLCKHFDWKLFPVAYLTGSLAWVITQNAVGLSAIVYFMLGTIFYDQLKRMKTNSKVIYIATMVIIFLLPLVIPKISFILHFIPFMVGVIIGTLKSLVIKFNKDLKNVTF